MAGRDARGSGFRPVRPVRPVPPLLVSNFHTARHSAWNPSINDIAIGFDVGSHNYELTSVSFKCEVRGLLAPKRPEPFPLVLHDAAGVWQAYDLGSSVPSTVIATLIPPAKFEDWTTCTFTAPSGTRLWNESRYFLVIDSAGLGRFPSLVLQLQM